MCQIGAMKIKWPYDKTKPMLITTRQKFQTFEQLILMFSYKEIVYLQSTLKNYLDYSLIAIYHGSRIYRKWN